VLAAAPDPHLGAYTERIGIPIWRALMDEGGWPVHRHAQAENNLDIVS
jgi:hypothetical protein